MNQLTIIPAPNLLMEIVLQSGPVLTLQAPTVYNLVLTTSGGGSGSPAAWGGITGTLSAQADLQAALDGKATAAQGVLAGTALQPGAIGVTVQGYTAVLAATTASYTTAEQAKLAGIAAGATANAADAFLLSRANHTGTQAVATITGLAAIATSGSASDLGAGTLPAGRFDDTAHGARAGGALHANAVAAGAAGFMTGADKTKLDGVATGANNYVHPNHSGDVTSVADGATTIVAGAVTLAKQANVATGTVFYRKTALAGAPEVQTLATLKTDLGLTGTNSGDQTSIVGITGTKAQFNTAVSDGDIQFVGDAPTAHTHSAANITDFSTAADARIAAASINALSDVIITAPSATQVLKYNGTNWINDTDATAGVPDGDKGDITVSVGGTVWTIDPGAVTLAKQADIATGSFIGRNTAATGVQEVLPIAAAKTMLNLTGTNSGDQTITLTGDVTGTGTGSFAATVAANAVTNAKLADVATATIKGRVTAATGDPEDLTSTQATTLINPFTSALKGLAPASGGGTTSFLRADGTWSPLTADRSYGQLAANYTLTSAITVQKLFNWSTNGALTLATGRYQFRTMIYITGMSATSGNAAFSLAGTATLADRVMNVLGIDSTTPLAAATSTGSATITSATVASMVTPTVGTGMFVEIGGMFNVTVTGTIIPSIQLVTAAAAIVQAGSYFECVRISDTGVTTLGTWA